MSLHGHAVPRRSSNEGDLALGKVVVYHQYLSQQPVVSIDLSTGLTRFNESIMMSTCMPQACKQSFMVHRTRRASLVSLGSFIQARAPSDRWLVLHGH